MSAVLDIIDGDDVVTNDTFFAPVSSDVIDGLLGQYQAMRRKIEAVAALFAGDVGSVVHYFIEGNKAGDGTRYSSLSAERIFEVGGAVAALNASFWQQALSLTDVYDYMPQKRRDTWNAQIRDPLGVKARGYRGDGAAEWEIEPLPDFCEDSVRPTILALLNSRSAFLAERVDGLFRGLSGHHVTNAPEGFGKRMIIAHVITSYDTTDHSRAGLINDLRCVIAKFMGTDDNMGWNASDALIRRAKYKRGEWITADGGALRIKVFKVGTAHLEIHPDMAWRLNAVLAQLHPLAIPAKFRQKPASRPKDWAPLMRPLPGRVLGVLAGVRAATRRREPAWPERYDEVPNMIAISGGLDSDAGREVAAVLESIGGTKVNAIHWQFDYDARDTIADIVTSGMIPDQVSHQYFPTPDTLAERCIDLAAIGPHDTCLEPSAGQGSLAARLPAERTTCVELSALFCGILRTKLDGAGEVIQGDFLALAERWRPTFDRVVMNPPFSEGRAKLHAARAAALLAPDGRLVAILPASMLRTEFLGDGFEHEWHGPFSNEFDGTGVSVAILVADRR